MYNDYTIKMIVYKQSVDINNKINWTTPYEHFCLTYNYFSPYSNTMINSPIAVNVYLYYILTEWNNLHDIILFTLFDSGDHSHFNITTHFSKNIHLKGKFYIELDKKGITYNSAIEKKLYIDWWNKYVCLPMPHETDIMYSSQNMFSVSKKCIHRHNYDYYDSLYKLLSLDPSYAKYIEWSWYYIFSN